MLVPSSTSAAVAVAAFHLERPSILVLGFVDGSIAVYDMARLFHGDNEHKRVVEIASAENVHTIVTEAVPSISHERHSSTGSDNIGNKSVSITSIAFVPGSECITVSIGADGKCCVTDFTSNPPFIRVWSTGIYATSLSVLRIGPGSSISQSDDPQLQTASKCYTANDVLVVIGCQDGFVLLYELSGKLLTKTAFEGNARIVDVEWLRLSANLNGYNDLTSGISQLTPYPLQTAFADAYALAEFVDVKAASFASDHRERAVELGLMIKHQHVVEKPIRVNNRTPPKDPGSRRSSPPEVPPRPTPREGGQLALRHAKRLSINTSTQAGLSSSTKHEWVPTDDAASDLDIAAASKNSPKHSVKTNSITGSNAGKSSLRKMSSIPPRAGSRDRTSLSQEVSTTTPTENSTDTIIDWTAASARRQTIPQEVQSVPMKKRNTCRLAQAAHHNTESQSMASDDTIIDWNPPLRSKKAVNAHEDADLSPAAVRSPVSRRSATTRRKPSTPISALSSSSLNPKSSITRKASANLRQQTSRRSSKPQSSPSPGIVAQATTNFPRVETDDPMALQALVGLKFSILQHEIVKSFLGQMEVLEQEIAKHFDAQKNWILKIMQDQDDWARKLEEENKLLRDELDRERKRREG